ncbi:hypothetical protein K488DRAFT_88877 [Vararia minispora EC-137]|uniref:Uncharacterized protein n=1 Tax=Vararia minispora EC-137 TaxID=1314806 RepID=A0ACB8QBX2_9AGAM|nr:hypothetical protein K488DRAFT_88877 [Vararia minispora EC-137]
MAEVLPAAVLALFVQTFFVYRIYRLSQKNIFVSGLVAVFVVGEFCTYAVYFGNGVHLGTFAELIAHLRPLSYSINIATAITDVSITTAMCFYLQSSRTGFRRTDSMLNRLTLFCVNTGLLTSTDAVCSLTSYLASENSFIYICFFFMLSRLYSNSLMATLNARRVRGGAGASNDGAGNSVTLGAIELGSGQRQFAPRALAVKVDTVREVRDEGIGSAQHSVGDSKVDF